ncbi:transposase [Parasediminibacterium sp. JCM 36343]|uniref:transposase n=1 Tax=Parasediminibacterium sp. JCM 36343 TaxID=3374279 RepID=UPI00397BC266
MHIIHRRQGQMGFRQAYFYTDTIHHFQHLLANDDLKMIIIQSWQYLVKNELADIYGYVIMPNHIHLIWNILKMNGKESVAGSFTKFTAHAFRKYLLQVNPTLLQQYKSDKSDRSFQFWKRDPLAIQISSEIILMDKLKYIHNNPIKEKWSLCRYPEEYLWSSARFYLDGSDQFGIVKDFRD